MGGPPAGNGASRVDRTDGWSPLLRQRNGTEPRLQADSPPTASAFARLPVAWMPRVFGGAPYLPSLSRPHVCQHGKGDPRSSDGRWRPEVEVIAGLVEDHPDGQQYTSDR